MPFRDSPGWNRQWEDHPWQWDFHVSTVSEGHRVVNSKEKSDAKLSGAKLTFGEVLDCGVSRMLRNLGAADKASFHDLGMGPGKMLLQTFLQYANLRTCMGVELAKGRYDLAERNMRTLLQSGWRGRSFLRVEFEQGEFMKIVEDVPEKTPSGGWKVGHAVVAFDPTLAKDKMARKDYHGVVTKVKKKKSVYAVKYDDGTSCSKVQHRHMFVPGTERTCEVWFGSLFDYPGGFDAEICVLETDFPEQMHPQLIARMCETPLGCTFLTYHDLKKFPAFDWQQLRQIDCNIYDNDRYITSWSQGWRFYLWQHIRGNQLCAPLEPAESLRVEDSILFAASSSDDGDFEPLDYSYGEIVRIDVDADGDRKLTVKTNRIDTRKVYYANMLLTASRCSLRRTRHRFRVRDRVCAYSAENERVLEAQGAPFRDRFRMHRATVIAVHADRLAYALEYDEGHCTECVVPEEFVYEVPELRFKKGERVMSCWPRNAQNKNCPIRYKLFPATVVEVNHDATYCLEFQFEAEPRDEHEFDMDPDEEKEHQQQHVAEQQRTGAFAPTEEHCYVEHVREMWIKARPKQVRASWDAHDVADWAREIGLTQHMRRLFELNGVDGAALLRLAVSDERTLMMQLEGLLTEQGNSDNKTESREFENEANGEFNALGFDYNDIRNLAENLRYNAIRNANAEQKTSR